MYFFISDTHFDNKSGGIIKYCNRPFSSIEEMNEAIIQKWNAKVPTKGSIVYHLGDFAFGNRARILELTRRLHGKIALILGNHDDVGDPKSFGFLSKHDRLEIKIENIPITLSHYAMRVWQKSHFDSWHLYGHSHGCLPPDGKTWDCSVEVTNYEPLAFDEIKKIMETRPHNLNWLERLPGYKREEFERSWGVALKRRRNKK